jgi:hypothetical protein
LFAAASLGLLAGVIAVTLALRALDRRARHWARSARRLAVRARDAEIRIAQQERLAEVQRRAEQAVEQTNATVRAIHRGIARIPFGILSRLQATRAPARVVQTVHDETSDVVYDSISAVNRLIGTQVRRGLRPADDPTVPPDDKSTPI